MAIMQLGDRKPSLPDDFYWIADNATVVGDVVLGAEANIWFGAVLRGDMETITVGAGSNVQDNAVLHTDTGLPLTIGRGCVVGHGAILHGCTIGDNTLIGMGAIVLNGATIGRDCLIAAGALLAPGATIPDGSVVMGAPGRVVRPSDERVRASNRSGAAFYVANARAFAGALRAV